MNRAFGEIKQGGMRVCVYERRQIANESSTRRTKEETREGAKEQRTTRSKRAREILPLVWMENLKLRSLRMTKMAPSGVSETKIQRYSVTARSSARTVSNYSSHFFNAEYYRYLTAIIPIKNNLSLKKKYVLFYPLHFSSDAILFRFNTNLFK